MKWGHDQWNTDVLLMSDITYYVTTSSKWEVKKILSWLHRWLSKDWATSFSFSGRALNMITDVITTMIMTGLQAGFRATLPMAVMTFLRIIERTCRIFASHATSFCSNSRPAYCICKLIPYPLWIKRSCLRTVQKTVSGPASLNVVAMLLVPSSLWYIGDDSRGLVVPILSSWCHLHSGPRYNHFIIFRNTLE